MISKNLKRGGLIGFAAAGILSLVLISSASLRASATSADTLMKKTLLNGLRTCYSSAYMTDGPVTGSAFRAYGIDTLLTDAGKTDEVVLVPTQVGNTVPDSKVTCQELFSGTKGNKKRGNMTGLLAGKSTDNITYFGYQKSSETPGNEQGCVAITYNDAGNTTQTTDTICFKLKDGKIETPYGESVITEETNTGGPVELYYDHALGTLKLSISTATPTWNPQSLAVVTAGADWNSVVSEMGTTLSEGEEWCRGNGGFCRPIDDAWTWNSNGEPLGLGYSYRSTKNERRGGETYEEYMKGANAVLRALRYLSGNSSTNWDNENVVKFTKEEAYDLYDTYFQKWKADQKVHVDSTCYSKAEKDQATASSGYAVYDGNGKWCGVRINSTTDADTEMYNVVNSTFDGLSSVNIKTILEKMTSWEFSYVEDPEKPPKPGVDPGEDDDDGGGGDATDLDQCFSSAGALGWILCPVINIVSNATDSIYENYIQSEFLEVKTDTVAAVRPTWQVIRNIANITFVIFFLIVLFSQLTGIGITNYGIKKMLPRLILVAVLVNVSYFLCELAVDASNILGYSFNKLFVSLAPDVNESLGGLAGVGNGVASALTWGGIALLAFNTAGAWLIPLLLALLSAIISVIFGGIVLGLRQAGVVVLLALVPAAIVCYALPNVKTIFDKWFKAFSSLLLVFPICGALMGAGYFAANLIMTSTDSILLSIIAMLIRVAPFFMIPSLVRSSLTAIGNIGTKITNWGNRAGRMATGAIARSDATKRFDANLSRHQGDMTALRGRTLNRILHRDPNDLSDRRRAKIARQYAKYNKLRSEEATANPMAMAPGSRDYTALRNAARQNRIDTLAKNIALENTELATDDTAMQERHAAALAAYNENQSDENLATIQAFQDMLIASGDGGRTALYDNYARAAQEGGTETALQAGAQHLVRNHTKDIKPNNRDFYSMLTAYAGGGDLHSDSFREYTNQSGQQHMVSSYFANQGVNSYDAQSLAKMDEGSLDRLIEQAGLDEHNGGLDHDARVQLEMLTREAMTNKNVSLQGKIANKFNILRTRMGFQAIDMAAARQSRDSGMINVRADNGGPTLNTGNDNRNNVPSADNAEPSDGNDTNAGQNGPANAD